MIKIFHLAFVILTIVNFVGRVVLAETHSLLLKKKLFKIMPHVIDTALLLSGVALVVQGQWLAGEYNWLIAKLAALLGYIGFGIVVMHVRGVVRWVAFVGAMGCFAYIGIVAVTKNALFFG